jgi:ABC-type Mn2+/Zn2+ transport system permease subunit
MICFASLWDEYASVLSRQFFQHALVAVILIGALCGVVGTYVVLRGFAFLGDALAHATFPGVAIAYLLGSSILGGALVAGFVTALLIGGTARNRRVSNDSAIGVLFAGAFALGVMLISRVRSYRKDLSSLLFGNILGVSRVDLLIICVIGVIVLGLVFLFFRELLLNSFDPTYAAALGYPTGALDLLLLGILTLTIVVGLQAVGNVLIVAMILTPSATARLLTDRVPTMMALGAGIGALAGILGLFISYPLELAPGATIVMVATLFFFIALLFAPRQGFVTAWISGRHRALLPVPRAEGPVRDASADGSMV